MNQKQDLQRPMAFGSVNLLTDTSSRAQTQKNVP
jgi:hypothetical protein